MANDPQGTYVAYDGKPGSVRYGDKGAPGISSDDVANDSDVVGTNVSEALDALDASIGAIGTDDVDNDSGVAGATCSDALDQLDSDIPDLSDANPADVGVTASGASPDASRSDHVHAHGNQGGAAEHSVATGAVNGFMSAADKAKLDGIAPGAGAPTQEVLFQPDFNANLGDVRTRSIAGTGGHRFSFMVPHDLTSVIDLELICNPTAGAAGAGKDIDLSSDYGADGEDYNNHSESDVGSTYDLGTVNQWTTIDISTVFSLLAAGDRCGVFVDQNGIGGTLHYLGIRLRYS